MILTPMTIADAPCNTPNHGVMVTKAAVPEYPDSARYLGIGRVTILVRVTVNADGSVANAQISKTSNNTALDQSALRSTHQSTYSPAIVSCAPQSSDATLAITMAPDGVDSMTVVPDTAAPACAIPNRDAAIIEEVEPDLSGLESHVTGPTSVTVRVSIDPNGRPGNVAVVSSSGDRLLDDAVIRAARLSKYTPRYVDCKPVDGDYVLLQSLK
jgi:TonB family protein